MESSKPKDANGTLTRSAFIRLYSFFAKAYRLESKTSGIVHWIRDHWVISIALFYLYASFVSLTYSLFYYSSFNINPFVYMDVSELTFALVERFPAVCLFILLFLTVSVSVVFAKRAFLSYKVAIRKLVFKSRYESYSSLYFSVFNSSRLNRRAGKVFTKWARGKLAEMFIRFLFVFPITIVLVAAYSQAVVELTGQRTYDCEMFSKRAIIDFSCRARTVSVQLHAFKVGEDGKTTIENIKLLGRVGQHYMMFDPIKKEPLVIPTADVLMLRYPNQTTVDD